MNRRLSTAATTLTVVLWVFWLVPLQGKKLAPEWFGSAVVQWTSAVVVAVCIPVAVLLALKLLSGRNQRRAGFGILFFACLPLVYGLFMYGIGGVVLARANVMIERSHERDLEIVAVLTDRALSGDTAERRGKSAGLLYGMFGVRGVWENGEGALERYAPTPDDEKEWERTIEVALVESNTAEMIDGQLKQMPWLFGLYLGSFSVIGLAGLAWRAYGPASEQGGD